jgi:hypothetical protein
MSETPEQQYFRRSRTVGIPLAEELIYWTSRVTAGVRTEKLTVSVGEMSRDTVFDCMKLLELFCNYAEELADEEEEDRGEVEHRHEQDALQQDAVDVFEEPHRRSSERGAGAVG